MLGLPWTNSQKLMQPKKGLATGMLGLEIERMRLLPKRILIYIRLLYKTRKRKTLTAKYFHEKEKNPLKIETMPMYLKLSLDG